MFFYIVSIKSGKISILDRKKPSRTWEGFVAGLADAMFAAFIEKENRIGIFWIFVPKVDELFGHVVFVEQKRQKIIGCYRSAD